MTSIKTLMLIGGAHHDFSACAGILSEAFRRLGSIDLTVTEDRDALKPDALAAFHAVVIYTGGGPFRPDQEQGLVEFVRGGGGLVGLHSAAVACPENEAYSELLGGRFTEHSPLHRFAVNIVRPEHPITARMTDFDVVDELYLLERHHPEQVELLASTYWQGRAQPMVYVRQFGGGKVCYNALGHGPETFADPQFQKLVHRSIRYVSTGLPPTRLRSAVLGYGGSFNMGKLHRDWARQAGIDSVAVCDRDPARIEAARRDDPEVHAYADLRVMLDAEQFDLLTVITPHHTHADLAVEALQAGRNVIVEKPMAISVAQCTAMIEAARKADRMLSVFHNRRWDGDYMAIRDQIRDGALGMVFQLEAAFGGFGRPGMWWRSDKRISGGLFFDWGAHFVDWLLGFVPYKIAAVDGFMQKKRWWHVTNEDHACVVVRFENGAVAILEQSEMAWVAPRAKWRILGSDGGLRLANEPNAPIEVVREVNGQLGTTRIAVPGNRWDRYYANIADHLIYGEPLAVSAESARRVIAVIETAEQASRTGRPLAPPYEDDYSYDRWL